MVSLLFVLSLYSQFIHQDSFSDSNRLKDELLESYNILNSIECSYNFCCGKRMQEQADNIDFRWKEGWLWYSSQSEKTTKGPDACSLVIESIIDGMVSGYLEKTDSEKNVYHTNYDLLRFMPYNELSPLTIIGISSPRSYYSYSNNLIDTLKAVEKTYIENTEQQIRLYLYPEPPDGNYFEIETTYGIIVCFNKQGYVEQIDYVFRPGCSLDEIQLFSNKQTPIHVYKLFARDSFSNYYSLGDYAIPLDLHRTLFTVSHTPDFLQVVNDLQPMTVSGLITVGEYETKMYAAISGYSIEEEWSVKIDPNSVRINNPDLSKKDFEIIPPKEPTVTWDIASGDFKDEFGEGNYQEVKEKDEARRIAHVQAKMKKNYALPIGVAIGAFSLALLATAIVLKVRSKR